MSSRECPFCARPGLRIIYGLMPGPAAPGEVSGGCTVFPGRSPDFVCEWCDAEWVKKRDGVTVVTSLGVNQASDLPGSAYLVTALESAAEVLRSMLQPSGDSSAPDVLQAAAQVGRSIGLSARQSRILMDYL